MMKHNRQTPKKMIAVAFTVGTVGLFGAGTAKATHTHSMETGNGSCVLLAQNGGEDDVTLPHADGPDNRRHPLHVNVHLGAPGRSGKIGVQGTTSDPCLGGDYLND
jgi:hypothetical protein